MDKIIIDINGLYLGEQLCVDTISVSVLIKTLENALDKNEELKLQLDDLERDIRENYKPIPFNPYDEYSLDEKDFH